MSERRTLRTYRPMCNWFYIWVSKRFQCVVTLAVTLTDTLALTMTVPTSPHLICQHLWYLSYSWTIICFTCSCCYAALCFAQSEGCSLEGPERRCFRGCKILSGPAPWLICFQSLISCSSTNVNCCHAISFSASVSLDTWIQHKRRASLGRCRRARCSVMQGHRIWGIMCTTKNRWAL